MIPKPALIKYKQTATGKRKWFHGLMVETPAGNVIGGRPVKVTKTGKGERAKIQYEHELLDMMEQKQLADRAGRLAARRNERGLMKLSKRNLNPSLHEAKTVLLQKYGFEPINVATMNTEADMRLMTKLSSKVIQKHTQEAGNRQLTMAHEMSAFEELGFLSSSMDALRGKKFGDKVTQSIIDEFQRVSSVGRSMAPMLKVTIDSMRGRLTLEEAETFLKNSQSGQAHERGEILLPVMAISGIDLIKIKKDLDPTSEFMNNLFQKRFTQASKSPILNGAHGENLGGVLKLAIEVDAQMRKERIPEHYYAGTMRGYMLLAQAHAIISSGGTRTRII